jgi:hypothetical protein
MNQVHQAILNFISSFLKLKQWLFPVILAAILFLGYKYFFFKENASTIEYNTNLIQEQIVNVGKIVVTEGHFAEVITYKDQNKYLMGAISFEKKAIVIVNADVTVAYDLHQMKYNIDEQNKLITILSIPKEEIKISPDLQYYDVEQSQMNPFTGDDYNKINKQVRADLSKKIEKSSLKTNAKNRLISELSKILILTNTMGWKLQYDGQVIKKEADFKVNVKG